MNAPESESRRRLLRRLALAASVGSLASTPLLADELPLIAESDPAAKAVKYVEDTKKVKESEGNRCDTCSLYAGKDGAPQGPCQIFKGKSVKAAGWCTAWAPQI
ncbi:MAG: high-potential iron-sulfur protein [Gammaproteobacteria bacterium]